MRPPRLCLALAVLVLLSAAIGAMGAHGRPPSFLVITHGFWGSMDNLPANTPAWLAESPYPHYRKHQEAAFLTGPDYLPIPQRFLRLSETGVISRSYAAMEREFAYWERILNQRAGWERVRIYRDWQVLLEGEHARSVGAINVIYLKYDWRLGCPQIARDYIEPLLVFLGRRWPGAAIHFVGHSQGGVIARYAACRYPGRLASLVTVGAPHYGLYEVGRQIRGERTAYGGDREMEMSQAIGLWAAERFFFGTGIIRRGRGQFPAAAAEFTARYIPGASWMDPESGLLADGFNGLTPLAQAVPQAVALYGLGWGSYDLAGEYHPALPKGNGVGPGLGPDGGPPAYARTGDGRVDPVSARGSFQRTLCLGRETTHGNLMRSPLVLTFLFDRYLFGGAMPRKDMERSLFRLGVEWRDEMDQRLLWLERAREIWDSPEQAMY